MRARVGEGRRRGIEIVGLEGELAVVDVDVVFDCDSGMGMGEVRTGRPAREAWMVEVGAWRWVPGPGR